MSSVKAISVTFDIVEFLSYTGTSPVKTIAAELDIPKSTVYDHLHSLQSLNYVVKEDSEYRLSSKFLWIGMQSRDQLRLYNIAQEEIDELARKTGEHAAFFIEENNLAVMLYTSAGEDAIPISQYDGMAFPPHCGAPGKVMLAYFPEERVEAIIEQKGLPKYTENTITDREMLLEELDEIRENGYGFERGEHLNGVRAVAVPVNDDTGAVVGAVTVYGPSRRLEGGYFTSELPEILEQTANIIEVNYTY